MYTSIQIIGRILSLPLEIENMSIIGGSNDENRDGYDVEVVQEYSGDFDCMICKKLMHDAVEMACGHGLCGGCFERLKQSCREREVTLSCPHCRVQIDVNNVRAAMMIRRLIYAMKVKCSEHLSGCQWADELSNLKTHLENYCCFVMVKCPNVYCQCFVKRNELHEHLLICEYRLEECEHCLQCYPMKNKSIHLNICELVLITCPLGCESVEMRINIKHHFNSCPLQKVACTYEIIGCDVKVERKAIAEHYKEEMDRHMILMLQFLKEKNTETVFLKEKLAEFEKRNDLLEGKVDSLEKELLNTRHDLEEAIEQHAASQMKISQLSNDVSDIKENVKALDETVSKTTVDVIETKSIVKNMPNAPLTLLEALNSLKDDKVDFSI